MPSVNKAQAAVIAGGAALFVLLLFANTDPLKKPVETPKAEKQETAGLDFASLIAGSKSSLSPEAAAAIGNLEAQLEKAAEKEALLDSLIRKWDEARKPVIAAWYTEQLAAAAPGAETWRKAGDRYFASTVFAKEEQRMALFALATKSYERSLELDPKDADTKINLAACYVESSPDPMKGISLLREVEKTDSNNINLQLNFAVFSVRSMQWDKAIARYEKVLRIDPDFIEAYLHLADVYQNKGDKTKAIESLEKYVQLVQDPTSRTEVQSYIDKLKNS